MSDLTAEFERAGQAVGSFTDAVVDYERQTAAENSRRVGRDRSWIAKTIVGTYGIAVLGMLAYVAFTMPECSPGDTACNAMASWQAQAKMLFDLIVTAVLPIVTLMLGFYFGTESTNSNQ